jgi:phosphoribosylglycinamide formyltransferase-1
MKKRVAILISGRGSNMEALIAAARAPAYPAEIALVLSNRPNAPGLAKAEAHGLPTELLDHAAFPTREAFEAALQLRLDAARIDLVCLAGFLRLFTPAFVERWQGRMLNIHPSLLPGFKGTDVHQRVLAAGCRISGCTVHFVTAEMDSGPILAQAAVPVLPDDTPSTLAARVLEAEHTLYPLALRLAASGQARLDDTRVLFRGAEALSPPLFSPLP